MVFVNKKDYFMHSHRTEFKFLTFAVFGTVLAFLGRYSAFFENIDGIIGCDSAFETLWSCAVVPVASAVISLIMCGTRETLVAVMCGKIGATLIGMIFGINVNIHLPVFNGDWGVLFFLDVDILIVWAIAARGDERENINRASAAVIFLAVISQIIGFVNGEFVPYYALRSAYIILFYRLIYHVTCQVVPRRMHVPVSFELDRKEKIYPERPEVECLTDGCFYAEDENGNFVKHEVLFSYDCKDDGNTYIVHTAFEENGNGNVQVYASYLNKKKHGNKLMNIEDDETYKTIEDIFIRLMAKAGDVGEENKDESNIS
jgi:uncharacterized protein YrzB (UPF0473 family)